MRKMILVALAAVVLNGCASNRTMTYQTTIMEEVEVAQPPRQVLTQDSVPAGAQEEVEVAQPPKTIIVQVDIPREFPGAKNGRKYLHIGYKPVNPNRFLTGDEKEFILPTDAYVQTPDRDGHVSKGWLLAGERVIGVPTSDPDHYKATWIRRCGNPILNDGNIAIIFKVRREVVAQPPIRVPRPRTQPPARMETVAQPSIKTYQPKVVTVTVPQVCGKKSGWGATIGEVVFGVASLLIPVPASARPYVSGGMTAVGSLTGAALEGGGIDCIDAHDLVRAGVTGTLAGALSAATVGSHPAASAGGSTPPHTLPGNGGGGGYAPPVNPVTGHTLPIN